MLNIRRVTELKNVCASSASGRPPAPSAWRERMAAQQGPLHDRVLQEVVHVGHGAVDVRPVERQPLGGVGLGARPVPALEPARARRVISSKPSW